MSMPIDLWVALGAFLVVLLGAAWSHRRDGTARAAPRLWHRRLPVALLVPALLTGIATPAGPVAAEGPCAGIGRPLTAFAFETITVSNAAVGFTAATLVSGSQVAVAARVTVETNSIRFREDGTDPTAAVGHQANPGDRFFVCGTSLGKFKMIRTAAPDAIAVVTYLRVN